MEHRCGERLAMNLAATLRPVAGEALRVIIRNLGCGGAFLAVPAARPVPRGLIELELRLPFANRKLHRWRAFVVHRQAGGVGVMFDDLRLGDLLPYLAAQKTLERVRPQANARAEAVSPTFGA